MIFEISMDKEFTDFVDRNRKFCKKMKKNRRAALDDVISNLDIIVYGFDAIKIYLPNKFYNELKTTYAEWFEGSMLKRVEKFVEVSPHDKDTIGIETKN